MVYADATQGWVAYNASNETDTALNSTRRKWTTINS
jgi:hypothetical protein